MATYFIYMELIDYLQGLTNRELDLLVAKRVLGITDVEVERANTRRSKKSILTITIPRTSKRKRRYKSYTKRKVSKYPLNKRITLPRYSMDTRDCFELLECLKASKKILGYEINADLEQWKVKISSNVVTGEKFERTAVLCILLTFLKSTV